MQKTQLKRPVVDIFCCCLFDFKSRESVDHRFMPDKNIGTVYFMLFIFYFLKIEKEKIQLEFSEIIKINFLFQI